MFAKPIVIDFDVASEARSTRRDGGPDLSFFNDFTPRAGARLPPPEPESGPAFWGPQTPLPSMSGGPDARPGAGVSPAAAIDNAVKLLRGGDPAAAERQAREVLKVLPQDSRALLVIGAARRRLRDYPAAKHILSAITGVKTQSAEAHYELGLTLAEAGEREAAITSLRRAAALQADFADAWIALSEQLYLAGDRAGATEAYDEHIRISVKDPELMAAIASLRDGRVEEAEQKLRAYLRANPGDVGATRLFAEVLGRQVRYEEAQVILEHCLKLAPDFVAARFNYALVLHEQNKPDEAIIQLEILLERQPDDVRYLAPLAACYVLLMDYERAVPLLERLVAEHPKDAKLWINYGQSLRIVGARDKAISAYRRAIALDPAAGDAYWSLADLKTRALDETDIAAMGAQVENSQLPEETRVALRYALGRAHEDRQEWEASFRHYAEGARLRRQGLPSDPDQNTAVKNNLIRQFTPEFFAERVGW